MGHLKVHIKKVLGYILKMPIYKNNTTFSFKTYIKNMKGISNELGKYGVSLYEDQNKEYILDHITSSNTTKLNKCRLSHSYKFVKASTYLTIDISRL